ncbi:MAG: 1-acyl-sn-glycerol-3-phosphate acyltransferase [Sphingomonas bacterium]|nr:1-acyl-sn-glycerol-3-phosphate acyltransferase [Sphingomonas bacterium]
MESPATAVVEPPSSRVRAIARIAAILGWFTVCVIPHLLSKLNGRSRWPRRFLAGVARICGADVRVEGVKARPGELLITNHVSWLDIMVLAGATGCAFISKAEIRGHPMLRWVADQNHTIYVDRAERRAIHDQARSILDGLKRDQPLALFPEGTVGDGGTLLPFKPSLLSAVAPPPDGVTLRPVAIDYQGRAYVLGWAPGEHGLDNALRILGRKGRLPVTVRLLAPLAPSPDRKIVARAAHDAIALSLAPSGVAPARL